MSVLGISSGSIIHTLAATFGLAAILAASAQAYLVISWSAPCIWRIWESE